MRLLLALPLILPLLLIAGCGGKHDGDTAAIENVTVPDAEIRKLERSLADATIRGAEPATSPSAQQARLVVELYYNLIEQKRYDAARKLWGSGGAESGGDLAAFTKLYDRFASFDADVGDPTDIKSSDGRQYISVHVTATVKRAGSPKPITIDGPIMLRRSVDPDESDSDKRDWRIWAADVRVRR